jgi:hypothetical protein
VGIANFKLFIYAAMKNCFRLRFLIIAGSFIQSVTGVAQITADSMALAPIDTIVQPATPIYKVAVFTPLYLDTAFGSDTTYKYARNEFPKFINPGLEFYEGVQIALDSFAQKNDSLEVFIYDSRSATQTLEAQLNQAAMDSVGLIIAYMSSSEIRTFASMAVLNKIPVVNVNLPNDGGIYSNPYFVLMNPTLRTQCEGIYKQIQKHHSLNKIVMFRKKGVLEDRIKTYFDDFAKTTQSIPLDIKYVNLPDSFTMNNLRNYLDTISPTLCIAGSLEESFGKRLALNLAALKKQNYKAELMGMPTWDGIADFKKPEYNGIDIMFSTPFYNPRTDTTSQQIIDFFYNVMFARPSDMVMRGYEIMWRFGHLLLEYKSDLASNMTNKKYNVFRDYDIQPVLNRQTLTLDYFENKKLYFLKWRDGVLKLVH